MQIQPTINADVKLRFAGLSVPALRIPVAVVRVRGVKLNEATRQWDVELETHDLTSESWRLNAILLAGMVLSRLGLARFLDVEVQVA